MYRIFTAWWQGFDFAPEIVKACHRSLLSNIDSDIQVVSITDSNLFEYVELPGYIIDKYKAGFISRTHFSDIVRCFLLVHYDCIWVDATIYFTNKISKSIFYRDLFTHWKNGAKEDSRIINVWNMSYFGGKSDFPLFQFMYDFFCDYWKHEDMLISYLLIDHIMHIGYTRNSIIKRAFDACDEEFFPVDYFQKHFNDEYGDSLTEDLRKCGGYLKTTYKANPKMYTKDGNLTLWGKLLQN